MVIQDDQSIQNFQSSFSADRTGRKGGDMVVYVCVGVSASVKQTLSITALDSVLVIAKTLFGSFHLTTLC